MIESIHLAGPQNAFLGIEDSKQKGARVVFGVEYHGLSLQGRERWGSEYNHKHIQD